MNTHHRLLVASVLACCASGVAFAGQESTIFTYDGKDFIRSQTTLVTEDGKSAVNTKLEHSQPAYKALIKKHPYSGEVTVFGQKCDAKYAPLTDAHGGLTGALLVAMCTKL